MQPEVPFRRTRPEHRDLCAGAQGAFNGMQRGRLLIQERPPKLLLSHSCGAVGAISLLFLMLFWYAQVRAGGFGAWIPGWVVARRVDGAFWRCSPLQGTCLVGLCLHRRGPQFERHGFSFRLQILQHTISHVVTLGCHIFHVPARLSPFQALQDLL